MEKFKYPTTIEEVIPDFATRFGYAPPLLDSNYQHIARKIALMWGSVEAVQFIEQDLIHHNPTSDRPSRAGFPDFVLKEITEILNLHIEMFPECKSNLVYRTLDPWL